MIFRRQVLPRTSSCVDDGFAQWGTIGV